MGRTPSGWLKSCLYNCVEHLVTLSTRVYAKFVRWVAPVRYWVCAKRTVLFVLVKNVEARVSN